MNCGALTKQCILVEYGNDRTFLCFHIGSNSANLDIVKAVVINALDVHFTMCLRDDSDVTTCNASITASVNKGVLAC